MVLANVEGRRRIYFGIMAATESSKRKPLIIGIAGGTGGKDTLISNT